jgi:hypothetical protein
MSLQNLVQSNSDKLIDNNNIFQLQDIKQIIEVLLTQMKCYYGSCSQIANGVFNTANFIVSMDAQNNASEEQALSHKNQADKSNNQKVIFEQLQNIIVQAQSSQENTNAAFAMAQAAQLQAQAAQNLANATFMINQRIIGQVELLQSFLTDFTAEHSQIYNLAEQSKNLSESVQTMAESAQASYYSVQNWAERSQEKPNRIHNYINAISNTL